MKLLFIGGLHRSGTTPFTELLGTHPDVSILRNTGVIENEGQFLQNVLPVDGHYGGPGLFGLNPEAHLTEKEVVSDSSAAKMLNSWKPYWDLSRAIYVEKSPINILRSRYLQSLYPQAMFIFVIRHPIAVTMATTKWCGAYIRTLIKHWFQVHNLLQGDLPYLKSYLLISYEELCEHPERALTKVSQFLSIESNRFGNVFHKNSNEIYLQKWKSGDFHLKDHFPRHKRQIKIIKNKLEARILENIYSMEIKKMGYSLQDVKSPPSFANWAEISPKLQT